MAGVFAKRAFFCNVRYVTPCYGHSCLMSTSIRELSMATDTRGLPLQPGAQVAALIGTYRGGTNLRYQPGVYQLAFFEKFKMYHHHPILVSIPIRFDQFSRKRHTHPQVCMIPIGYYRINFVRKRYTHPLN